MLEKPLDVGSPFDVHPSIEASLDGYARTRRTDTSISRGRVQRNLRYSDVL